MPSAVATGTGASGSGCSAFTPPLIRNSISTFQLMRVLLPTLMQGICPVRQRKRKVFSLRPMCLSLQHFAVTEMLFINCGGIPWLSGKKVIIWTFVFSSIVLSSFVGISEPPFDSPDCFFRVIIYNCCGISFRLVRRYRRSTKIRYIRDLWRTD